jgi:hypothetical protein
MPKSKHRKNHKQKVAGHKTKVVARRAQVKRLVGELEQEFAKLQAPVPTYMPAPGHGTFLTATEIDITQL